MLLTEASKRVTVDTPDFSQPVGTLIVAVNPFSLNRIIFVFEWLTLNPGSFCSRRISHYNHRCGVWLSEDDT